VKQEIEASAKVVLSGGIILYPTDTVWGLGCDPKNEKAIRRILEIKKKVDSQGLIVLVNSWPLLQRYARIIPEICNDLVDFAQKPMTVIYPQGQFVSPLVLGDDGSIGIRLTSDEFCSGLIGKIRMGLVSTSANLSGEPAPKSLKDVNPEIKAAVDYVVNLPSRKTDSPPSQIVKVGEKNQIQIIRK